MNVCSKSVSHLCLPKFEAIRARYDTVYLTRSKKLTNKSEETKNKLMSVISPVQSAR